MAKSELVKRVDALALAKEIGCTGAHKDHKGNWMPCSSMEEMERISNIAETSKWRSVVPGYKKEDAPRTRGRRKKRKVGGWENLEEKPISGIVSIPGPDGGLISGNLFSGKAALGQTIGERYNSAMAASMPSSGIDADNDGRIDDGTESERPAPQEPKQTNQPQERKIQKVYKGGRRFSRSMMPLGPDPKNYPRDKYLLVNEDGSPYDKPSRSSGGMQTRMKSENMSGPEYVRDNDPDVFIDADSARARSRQLGCIGISRRVSKSGRVVWMPCTNMSDYSNRTGSTSLGRRNMTARRENEVRQAVRTVLVEQRPTVKRRTPINQELRKKR